MGVDVQLWAEGTFTPEQIAQAEAYILARSDVPDPEYNDGKALRTWAHRPNRVELYSLMRYYGPGYERGDWPSIYGAIRLMREVFPDARIFYGGDTWEDEWMEECTDEFLADMWEHYLSPRGDDYRAAARAWNEQRKAALGQ